MSMRWVMRLVVGCMAMGLGLPGPLGAEEAPPVLGSVDVVVTATKGDKTLADVPGSVTVVTRQDLQAEHIQTVDDALNSLAGVFVKRSKGLMDSTASVRLRGFNGDQYTLILLDGQPLNDAYTGGLDWGTLPTGNIERIEVVRGAASSLYGGNAMGGVINIITRTPDQPQFSATTGWGANAGRRYRLSAGDRLWDCLSLHIGYEEEETDGYVTTPVVATVVSGAGTVAGGYPMNDKYGNPGRWVVGDKGDNAAERRVLDAKLLLDFSDTGYAAFTAVSGRNEYDYGPPHTYLGTYGDNTTYAIAGDGRARFRPNDFISYTGIGQNQTDTYTLALEEKIGLVKLNAQAGTVIVDDRYTLETGSGMQGYVDSPGSLKITENQSRFGELRGDLPLGQAHTLTMGASYRLDESDTDDYEVPFYRCLTGRGPSTFYSGGNSKTWALFAQDEWRVIEPVSLYLGLRYDAWKVYDGVSGAPDDRSYYPSNTKSEVSPKIAAVYRVLPGTTLRASVGQAFRAPTLYELYRSWQSYATTYQSNPALKPEKVLTYEMGLEQYLFGEKTRLAVTAYLSDIEDLIYYQTDGNTKLRNNAGAARTYGLELEASQEVFDWFTLWANYTLTDTKITDNPTDIESEYERFAGIPRRVWNLGLDARNKWVSGSIAGHYSSKIYNDSDNRDDEEGVYGTYQPSLTVDAKLTLTPHQGLEVSLSVDNLFDREYYEYYLTNGRTYMAEVSLRY